MTKPRLDFGIDAPDVIRRFMVLGTLGVVLGFTFWWLPNAGAPGWLRWAAAPCVFMGLTFFVQAGAMLWGSKVGKLRLRDRILDGLALQGDESVLDVGCGHGLMLIGAAQRLTIGKATGIDIWQREDQAGNSRDATWHNVELAGVTDRVELVDGDARQLPFPAAAFDVAVSSWALHNIYEPTGRQAAVREIVRVLKPGGRLAIVDIRFTREYEWVLREAGLSNTVRRGPNCLFIIPTWTLTAAKPS